MNTKTHSKYSASASERFVECPGSIQLSEKAPPQVESSYAKEGTDAHTCLEELLKVGPEGVRKAYARLQKKYPKEMLGHAADAAIEIFTKLNRAGLKTDSLLVEQKLSLSFIDADFGGTCDAAIVEEFGRLEVIDFKYGAGVAVEPEDNYQLMAYASAIAHQHDYNFAEVALTIIQPRAFHENGTTRTWVTSINTLRQVENIFQSAIEESKMPGATLRAGDHCRWCPAAAICPEISSNSIKDAQMEFDDTSTPAVLETVVPKSLSPDKISKALFAVDKIEIWADALREHAFDLVKSGTKIPGWKMVAKRSTRKYLDPIKVEAEAKKKFGAKAFSVPELLSPAQLEKVAGKPWIKARVTDYSPGFTLAPLKDKRPEVSPALDFDEVPLDTKSKPKAKTVKPITKGKTNGRKNGH